MPSLGPVYDQFTSTAVGAVADANTGALRIDIEGAATQRYARLGHTFAVPGDVSAIRALTYFTVTYDVTAWGYLFGAGAGVLEYGVHLYTQRPDGSYLFNRQTFGVHVGPVLLFEYHNRSAHELAIACSVDWGEAFGMETTWVADAFLRGFTVVEGASGAWVHSNAVVPRIDYELFWRW